MIGVNRRRVMGGEKCPYVTDGLIHWFDGIDKGGDNEGWLDLIGGTLKFVYNEHSTIEGDCIHMDGEGCILLNSAVKLCRVATETLEVVAENVNDVNTGAIYNSGWQDYESLLLTSYGYAINPSGWTQIRWNTSNKPHKFAFTLASHSNRFINGVKDTSALGSNSYTITQNASLGGLPSANFINCRVYCIRMYNRVLTDEEVLSNLAVDNERFNLGLTI